MGRKFQEKTDSKHHKKTIYKTGEKTVYVLKKLAKIKKLKNIYSKKKNVSQSHNHNSSQVTK